MKDVCREDGKKVIKKEQQILSIRDKKGLVLCKHVTWDLN